MSTRLLKNIDLTVKFSNNLSCHGLAEYLDDDVRPREFLIQINSTLSREEMIMTLAHELTHVKQFARGELKLYTDKGRWKKKTFILDKLNYYLYPWEIEAFGYGHALYQLYIEEGH